MYKNYRNLFKARTTIVETGLPKYLWCKAIMCAAYQLHRCPTTSISNQIPAEIYNGKLDLFAAKAWAIILPKKN